MAERTRSLDSRYTDTIYGKRILCNGSETDDNLSVAGCGSLKTTNDVVTPNYAQLIARGAIINNPFLSITTEKIIVGRGSYHWIKTLPCSGTTQRGGYGEARFYNLVSQVNLLSSLDASIPATLAGTQAKAGIVPPDIAGLVALAEMRKTAKMILNPLSNVRTLLNEIRSSRRYRSRKSKYRSFFDFMSSEYLRYRYGFVPLMYDIDGLMNTMVNPASLRSTRQTSRGYSEISDTASTGPTAYTTADDKYSYTVSREHSREVSSRAGVLYEHKLTTTDLNGLSLQNLPSAAWELVPYSFVADWFVNAGQYIQALEPRVGVKTLASWTVTKTVDVMSYTTVGSPKVVSGLTITGSPTLTMRETSTTLRRSPGVSTGLVFAPRSLGFRETNERLHLIDALFLTAQRFR